MVEIALMNCSESIKTLIDLHTASFESNLSQEYWKWKFVENPMAQDVQKVVVALDGGKIVGARPHMFGEMWLKDKKTRVAQHCDTMVHPDYQRKGIFTRMEIFALKQLQTQGIAFSYGFPNKLSRGGFLKLGYKRVIDTMAAVFPVNSYSLISTKTKSKFIAKTASFLFNLILNRKKRISFLEDSTFEFEVLNKFTAGMEDIELVRSNAKIDLVRSKKFLQWRFDSHPVFDYKYVLIKKNRKLLGYAVVSVQTDRSGITIGRIVDHVVTGSDINCYRHLMNKSLLELDELDSDCYAVFASGEPELEKVLLKDFGFKSLRKFPYKRFIDDGCMDAIQINKHFCNNLDISNGRNWRVTYAFYNQT
jgi:GNAT superfamily N-acetyltransferase